jgi:hypothetical protein
VGFMNNFCSECGAPLGNDASFCSRCGTGVDMPGAEGARKQGKRGLPKLGRGRALRLASYGVLTAAIAFGSAAYGNQEARVPGSNEIREDLAIIADDSEANSSRRADSAERYAEFIRCKRQSREWMSVMQEIDSRLDVGLSFQDYSSKVGDMSVAYQRVRFGQLSSSCVAALVLLEKAHNKYVSAYNKWNDCIGDFGCSLDDIEGDMQIDWLVATNHLAKGRRKLNDLQY